MEPSEVEAMLRVESMEAKKAKFPEAAMKLDYAADTIAALRKKCEEQRGLLLWTLYHHQGGSSEIGQPIRRSLGIGRHDPLTEEQIAEGRVAAFVMSGGKHD